MGMFDTIWIEVTCPTCKKKGLTGAQTKEFGCNLIDYEVGDHVPTDKYRWVRALALCNECSVANSQCESCGAWKNNKATTFWIHVMIDCDRITGEYSYEQ